METYEMPELLRLSRDIRDASTTLLKREARYLVDMYYQMQNYRIASANQVRSMTADEEPHLTIGFFSEQMSTLEKQIKRVLDDWTSSDPLGEWAKSITGIGPVIAAGLLAHIDMEKAPTVGHIWRYAGLDPTSVWGKGEKRPWNASLKVVCWKAGESFVKVSGNKKDFYGKIYLERKQYEIDRNEAVEEMVGDAAIHGNYSTADGAVVINDRVFKGGNAIAAANVLQKKKIGKDTDAYKAYSIGMLPPAHIHARAKRYAVKLFLAHFHEQGYRLVLGKEPPAPYPIAHLGHAHKIEVPNAA